MPDVVWSMDRVHEVPKGSDPFRRRRRRHQYRASVRPSG